MLDKLQWTVLAITILFQFSCVCNKVPDITWDIPKETDHIIITNHYKPLILENGEIVCGEFIEGISEFRNDIEMCNDTVYYDKDSRVLLHKNKDFRQRSFFNSQGQLYQRIVKRYNDITITTWNYDSLGQLATKVITDEYGIVKEKSIYIHDANGRIIETIKNDSISILYNYAPSSSHVKVITEKYIENNKETKKILSVYDSLISRVISRKIEKSRDNINSYTDEYLNIQKWNYNSTGTCSNYFKERRDYNGKLIEKTYQQYIYNSCNDLVSVKIQSCSNYPIIYRRSDGSKKIEYGDNYQEELNQTYKYIYEYKYDDKGRWIYRIQYKYNSAPYNLFHSSKTDTIVTVREIRDIHK